MSIRRIFSILIILLLTCAISASAESRYILPDGWYYNSSSQIVSPSGDVYNSIWDQECMRKLQLIDWGYGDVDYMEKHLRIGGDTAELGDSDMSLALLSGIAGASLIGIVYAGKKVRNAA